MQLTRRAAAFILSAGLALAGASAFAADNPRVKFTTNALVPLYTAWSAVGSNARPDATLMIAPALRSTIAGSAARVSCSTPSTFTCTIASSAS